MKKSLLFTLLSLFLILTLGCSAHQDLNMSNKDTSRPFEIDGALGKLSAIISVPPLKNNETCPMVILMHGFTSSKDESLLVAIADKLKEKGIASIRFDFNGHGQSEGDFQNMTVLNEIEDAKKIYEYVNSLPYVNKIALLGHSQGGVVSAMLAGELGSEKISRLVLLAPAGIIPDGSLSGNIMGNTFDPLNPPEYISVLGHKLGADYIKTAQTLPIYETASLYTGPAFVIHGTNDEVVPYEYGERFVDGYSNGTLHLLENDDHVFKYRFDEAVELATDYLEKIKY